ncbi:unnamed protein product [Amoebophrya sp. A25]|nr:unnamed protein product [Amoebophrya sp. A25]|eukprot:GSA25T00005273001.1
MAQRFSFFGATVVLVLPFVTARKVGNKQTSARATSSTWSSERAFLRSSTARRQPVGHASEDVGRRASSGEALNAVARTLDAVPSIVASGPDVTDVGVSRTGDSNSDENESTASSSEEQQEDAVQEGVDGETQTGFGAQPAPEQRATTSNVKLAAIETGGSSSEVKNTVSKNIRHRLYDDSRTLGTAAEQLLGIQADLNRVQTEVQGQVFDLETVRNFFSEHQYLTAANKQLEEKSSVLLHKVATIGQELVDAQREFANTTAALRARAESAELAMQKLTEREGEIEKDYIGHRASIAEDEKIRAENSDLIEKMRHMNKLETEKHEATQAAAAADEKVKHREHFAEELQGTIKTLRQQVAVLQKGMGEKDAILVDHVKKLKDAAKKVEDADNARILTLEQGAETLQIRIKHQEGSIASLTARNAELESLLKSVQGQAVTKFEQMKDQIGQYKTHVVSLRESVAQNIAARKTAENEAQRLTQLLVKSDSQTLKNQLDEVKKAQAECQNDLRDMSTEKARAEAARVEAESARSAAENTAAIERAAAEKARAEKAERVASCEKQKAEELEERGKELLACNTAMNNLEQQKCGARWAELNKESVAQIEKCKIEVPSLKEKVRTLKSEVAVLQAAANGRLLNSEPGTSGEASANAETGSAAAAEDGTEQAGAEEGAADAAAEESAAATAAEGQVSAEQ